MTPSDTPPSDTSINPDGQARKRFAFAPREEGDNAPVQRIIENDRKRKGLRLGITIGIGLIATVVLSFISITAEDGIKLQVTAENPQISDDGALKLEGLTYKGITSDGNNFIVLAEVATELPNQPELVELESPRARVDSTSGNPMTIRSNKGELNRDTELVELNGRVVIVRPDIGYTLMTEAAVAHLNTGRMTSDKIVRGYSPRARVRAEGMIINDNGQDVLFTGKSTLTIRRLQTP